MRATRLPLRWFITQSCYYSFNNSCHYHWQSQISFCIFGMSYIASAYRLSAALWIPKWSWEQIKKIKKKAHIHHVGEFRRNLKKHSTQEVEKAVCLLLWLLLKYCAKAIFCLARQLAEDVAPSRNACWGFQSTSSLAFFFCLFVCVSIFIVYSPDFLKDGPRAIYIVVLYCVCACVADTCCSCAPIPQQFASWWESHIINTWWRPEELWHSVRFLNFFIIH